MLRRYYRAAPFLLLAMLAAVGYSVMDGIVTIKMMSLLDYALDSDMAAVGRKAPELLMLAASLVPLGVLMAMANNYYKKQAMVILKKYYLQKVFGKNVAEFQKENNAKYLSSMTNDFNTLEKNLIEGVYTVGNCAVKFGVGAWLLSTVDPRMVLLAVLLIAVNVGLSALTSKPSKKAYKERSDMFDGYTSYIKEILSAFHIVKNYNLQQKVTDDYYEKSDAIQHKGYIIERLLSFVFASENFLIGSSIYGVVCALGYMVIIGRVTAGGLLLVVNSIQKMMWPLYDLSEALPKIFTTGELMDKMEKSLENSDRYTETVALSRFNDSIELKEVEFSYEDAEQVILKDIDLTVRKNGKYLIVGPSGGGKSTLLKLLRKYFNPTAGKILIDGYDLRDITRESYYKLVANIEQQVFIFEDTVKNNITLYKDYSEEEVKAAVEAAGLTDFVKALPDGLDTVIYDNGRNISGGERSRIVIARALLGKAGILFMDEAFASLDMERAREIEKTILNLKNITVINVSHIIFKDTRDLYDRVITVKKGIY